MSKKYGRHFQNNITSSSTVFQEQSIKNDPAFIASASLDRIKPVSEMGAISKKYHSNFENVSGNRQKNFILKAKRPALSKKKQKKIEGSDVGRKLEPIGLGATGLFVITSLVGISMGFTPLLFVLLGIAMVAGGVSVHRISANKRRWKGQFFGVFVVITGILLFALLGISALILAVFGNS